MATKKAVKNKKVVEKKEVEKEEVETEETESDSDDIDAIPAKKSAVKELDIDPVDVADELPEKVAEEDDGHLPFMDDEDEDALTLDGDEINPFGDKWEE